MTESSGDREDRGGHRGSARVKPRRFRSRIAAATFGVVLLGAGALSGLFAAVGPLRWLAGDPAAHDWRTALLVILFGPMTAILLGAASSMLRYAARGEVRPLVDRGAVRLFAGILAGLLAAAALGGLLQGSLDGLATALEGVAGLALMLHFIRAAPQIEALDRDLSEPEGDP